MNIANNKNFHDIPNIQKKKKKKKTLIKKKKKKKKKKKIHDQIFLKTLKNPIFGNFGKIRLSHKMSVSGTSSKFRSN